MVLIYVFRLSQFDSAHCDRRYNVILLDLWNGNDIAGNLFRAPSYIPPFPLVS
ncbi:MAG: hypothetical protein V2J62_07195 [candidate division KSB1 bacterium]|nr:hypothetical protein [candidate division KSB1 bacterium]